VARLKGDFTVGHDHPTDEPLENRPHFIFKSSRLHLDSFLDVRATANILHYAPPPVMVRAGVTGYWRGGEREEPTRRLAKTPGHQRAGPQRRQLRGPVPFHR
jgi:hypothetical protein